MSLIASIALANNLTLVTHNTGEFSRVEGELLFKRSPSPPNPPQKAICDQALLASLSHPQRTKTLFLKMLINSPDSP